MTDLGASGSGGGWDFLTMSRLISQLLFVCLLLFLHFPEPSTQPNEAETTPEKRRAKDGATTDNAHDCYYDCQPQVRRPSRLSSTLRTSDA